MRRDETISLIVSECSKLVQKRVQNKAQLGGKGDLYGIVLEIET